MLPCVLALVFAVPSSQPAEPFRTFVGNAVIDEAHHNTRGADPELAVGPEGIVLVVNSKILVLDRDGTELVSVPFDDLGGASQGDVLIDPEVVYDTDSGEYFVTWFRLSPRRLYFGVLGSDPSNISNWAVYSVPAPGIDQPNLTVHSDSILIWTIKGTVPVGDVQWRMIEKAAVLARPSVAPQVFPDVPIDVNALAFETRSGPSLMLLNQEFLLSAHMLRDPQGQGAAMAAIRLLAMDEPSLWFTDPPGNDFDTEYDISVPQAAPQNQVLAMGGGLIKGIAAEFRSRNEYVNDNLWLVHTVSDGTNASRIRWYQIDLGDWPSSNPIDPPCIVRSGDILAPPDIKEALDPTASVFNPSIAVNKYGTAVIAYLVSGDETPVTWCVSEMLPSETEFSEAVVVRTGTGLWNGPLADYSRVVVDALNPHVFWMHHALPEEDPQDPGHSIRTTWVSAIAPIYCPADLTGSDDPQDPSYGVPDGRVDSDDLAYFLDEFEQGNFEVDLSSTQFGIPDFSLTEEDVDYYLDVFDDTCEGRVTTVCP